ncbi:MAG TPA: alpha/beta hydrolase [Acidobacteriota bacterium]|nr:alpha/beta hydrolase [Acidobacteriota bacterium]
MTGTRARLRPRPPRLALVLLLVALLAAPLGLAGDAPPWSDEQGGGEPTIVLLHGLGADRHVWDLVAPRLAKAHRVVRVELPGHGASPALRTVSVKEAARAVDRALSGRRVEKAVIVGHSYGAWIALEGAVAKPKRTAAVVVLDMGSYTPADSTRIASLETYLKERYPSLIRVIFETMSEDRTEADSAVALALRVPADVLSAYFRDSWRTDLRPRIRDLTVPVHVIAASGTWPASQPWEVARRHFGYETKGPVHGYRVENSGHLIMRDQPDTLVALIERIAAGVGAGAGAGSSGAGSAGPPR